MKVALLTGGGDCPGLNPVIRGAVQTLTNAGHECIGLLEGWKGAIEGNSIPLTPAVTDGIIDKGGTILFSSRTNQIRIRTGIQSTNAPTPASVPLVRAASGAARPAIR